MALTNDRPSSTTCSNLCLAFDAIAWTTSAGVEFRRRMAGCRRTAARLAYPSDRMCSPLAPALCRRTADRARDSCSSLPLGAAGRRAPLLRSCLGGPERDLVSSLGGHVVQRAGEAEVHAPAAGRDGGWGLPAAAAPKMGPLPPLHEPELPFFQTSGLLPGNRGRSLRGHLQDVVQGETASRAGLSIDRFCKESSEMCHTRGPRCGPLQLIIQSCRQ